MKENFLQETANIFNFFLKCTEKSKKEPNFAFFLLKEERNQGLDFRGFLNSMGFTENTPYGFIEMEDDSEVLKFAKNLLEGEKKLPIGFPLGIYFMDGEKESVYMINELYEEYSLDSQNYQKLSPEESLTTLLYLSKHVAITQFQSDEISPGHVYFALEYVKLTSLGYSFFSQYFLESIDDIPSSSEGPECIEMAKDYYTKLPYSEDMKELIAMLKSNFSDEPICKLRIK